METLAVLARTAPPLAGTGRRPSAAFQPSTSLSFAASSRPRCCLGVGLSAATAGSGRAAGARRAVARRIVASSEVEQTYIMIKPDGVQRCLVGEIISRFEKKGFLLKGLKLFQCRKDLAQLRRRRARPGGAAKAAAWARAWGRGVGHRCLALPAPELAANACHRPAPRDDFDFPSTDLDESMSSSTYTVIIGPMDELIRCSLVDQSMIEIIHPISPLFYVSS